MKDQIFTYSEVCGILCEGCQHGVPDCIEGNTLFHYLNGERIVCRANTFRRKADRSSKVKEVYKEQSWEK